MHVPRRYLSMMATGVAVALVASSLWSGPALAARPGAPKPQAIPSGPALSAARPAPVPAADPSATSALRKAPAVSWPTAGTAEVSLPAVSAAAAKSDATPSWQRAGDLPIRVGHPDAAGPSTTRVSGARPEARIRVEVLDRKVSAAAGVRGVVLRLAHVGDAVGPASVEVDYSGFRHAYGGDYGSRLRLLRLPECALTTASAGNCAPTPLASTNDAVTGRVRAKVSDGLYALAAAPSGSAGTFQPTSLAPSATWQVGLQSGDFNWSYPMALPPMPGRAPEVSLAYSSGSVDGRVVATNNQPSWVGEGFDLPSGFIERSYRACRDDGGTGSGGDLCWEAPNATLVLPGLAAGELVPETSATDNKNWHLADDRGWRVTLLTGASNGDDNGEHWRVTAPDGTQYFFGRTTAANSAFTVPVFGNGTGEPCHQSTFATSWCQQAYRWNLDYVLDRHGDAVAYHYDQEINYYARNDTTPTAYVRGGNLARIEYGLRAGSSAPAGARVVLTAADRCLPGSTCTQAQPQNWPDVPWDTACSATSCAVTTPTFWSTKRLATVTAQVRVGTAYQNADSWTLTHGYLDTGDGTSPGLWLQSVVRTGHVGGNTSLPAVTFGGTRWANRVDGLENISPMNKWRITTITNETGGRIAVSYGREPCDRSALPVPDTNTTRCFPVKWTPDGGQLVPDWFIKTAVTQVVEDDATTGPDRITQYQYLSAGDAAWAYDDAELVPADRKSWGQWRGYQRVRVLTGAPPAAGAPDLRTVTEHLFLRGLDGDRTAGGTRTVSVVDSRGGSLPDRAYWRGFARETTTYRGAGGGWVSTVISEPTQLRETASRDRPTSTPLESHLVAERAEETYTALADGGVRRTRVVYTHEPDHGTLTEVDDQGDVSLDGDDTCTTYTYARNTTDWIVDKVSRVQKVGVRCGGDVSYPGDLISDQRYHYDENAWGTAPTKGDLTRTEEAATWASGAPVYQTLSRVVADQHGRPVEEFDARNNRTGISYTPALGGPVTQLVRTNPLGHTSTTTLEPLRGAVTAGVDANGGRTSRAYDALGRATSVWLPGRATTDPANLRYEYLLRSGGAAVTTRSLLAGGGYRTSYEVYDGLLRLRQTQDPSPAGGRVLTDVQYDPVGRVDRRSGPQYDRSGPPGTTLLGLPDSAAESQTRTVYDSAGRPTAEILLSRGVERWRTSTTYGGNWTAVDPPQGGTATMSLADAAGRVVERRQYVGDTPSGNYDATRYGYTRGGQLATVVDPAGNTWRYAYDMRGRQVRAETPDTGATTRTFDAEGHVLSTTDARGRTLSHTYDALGRRTSTDEGATRLAGWAYDTAPNGRGLLAASTRHVGANAYVSAVTGYDVRGRRTGTAVTIPAAETGLGGTYATGYQYDETDQVTSTTIFGGGGLPAETLVYGFDGLGLPTTMTSGAGRYVGATTRDGVGRPISRTSGASGRRLWQAQQWDAASGRLTATSTTVEDEYTSRVTALGYTYDPAGNVRSVVDAPDDGSAADTQCFGYDHLRRLTDAWTPTGGCATPAVSGLGGAAPYWHSYGYDRTGNRLAEVRHLAGGDVTRTFDHPAAGTAQPHTVRSVTSSGPGESGTDTFGYDASGNQTSRRVDGTSQQLDWDAEGHLGSVTTGAGGTSYLYDADGTRLLRRDAGGTTLYLGDTELRATGTGAVTGTRYYRFGGDPVAVRVGAELSWLVTDLHGTAGVSVDAEELGVTRRYRLPFGGQRGVDPAAWPGGRDFVGGVADPTGLTHLGAREYDPDTGGFVSADPIVDHDDPQQVQGYSYASGNPVSFSDANGLKVYRGIPAPAADGLYDPWACANFGSMCSGTVDPDGDLGWEMIHEVYTPNSTRDASKSPVYGCSYDNPGPAVACQQRSPSQSAYVLAERPCRGWDQCISPRPVEWQPADEVESTGSSTGGGSRSLAATLAHPAKSAGGASAGGVWAGAASNSANSLPKYGPDQKKPQGKSGKKPPGKSGFGVAFGWLEELAEAPSCGYPLPCPGPAQVYGGPYGVPKGSSSPLRPVGGGSGSSSGGLVIPRTAGSPRGVVIVG
ncbi:RHS repeat-associated core domain-containing protein [Micromonospora sp. NPDC049101]|uniref:RHS repeat-associated core domain-containing protein n=1 Tax=Micromonospora sp. NPDC049101 TaxID=3155032 RepID=UPI0033C985D2